MTIPHWPVGLMWRHDASGIVNEQAEHATPLMSSDTTYWHFQPGSQSLNWPDCTFWPADAATILKEQASEEEVQKIK